MIPDSKSENPLVDELLSDVADSFFSARKQVDEMRAVLEEHVQGLQAKEDAIRRQLGLLTDLLVDPETAAAFFRMLGVAPEALKAASRLGDAPAGPAPFVWRAKSKYIKLVQKSYAELHFLLDDYQNGAGSSAGQGPVAASARRSTYGKLVVELAKLINAKVSQVNRNMTPSGTLQFVKQFDAPMQLKDFVAGSNIGDYSRSLDAKLKLKPIDLESLPIVDFPLLPVPDVAAARIEAFCRKTFKANRRVLVHRLAELARLRLPIQAEN